jgi:ferredoxin
MIRALRIQVDHQRCQGVGMCLLAAPNVFAHNERSQSVVVDPRGDPAEQILEAARQCPTLAIRVEDAATGERLFPPPGLE